MDTRKVSAAAGFILLMGCIVGVVVVIYRGGSARSSYKSTVEESWKKREMRMKELLQERNELGLSTSEASIHEAKILAEELQKLFSKNPNMRSSNSDNGGGGSSGNNRREDEVTGPKIGTTSNSKLLSLSEIPAAVGMNLPTLPNHPSSPDLGKKASSHHNDKVSTQEKTEEDKKADKIISEESTPTLREGKDKNEFYQMPWIPSINSRLQKIVHHQMTSTNNGDKEKYRIDVPSSLPSGVLSPDRDPVPRDPSISMSTAIYSNSGTNLSYNVKDLSREQTPSPFLSHSSSYTDKLAQSEWDLDDEDILLDDYEQQYLLEDNDQDLRDPLKEMGTFFELVTDLYNKGTNGTNFNGILRVINETVQRGNNSGLLTQLNELYSRPGNWSKIFTPDASTFRGNSFENSLSAFVFMSFGIFLLNQIHEFVDKESYDGKVKQGRSLQSNSFLPESSDLNILFEPPQQHLSNETNKPRDDTFENSNKKIVDLKTGQFAVGESHKNMTEIQNNKEKHFSFENLDSSDYANNLFRAVLNLVNAYTKDPQALECIWSLYCQDLDKTSTNQGSLYSLAARINSIGLRLIMGQIPTELTVDVMLRSLLGWDGLPCMKMFPKCQVDDGTVKLQMKQSIFGNNTSIQKS